jgi:uncharacterized protein YjlB
MGLASGRASLILDGRGALMIGVAAGDALVLPVAAGHCLIEAREDFLVVGAYPAQDWEICQHPSSKEALERIPAMIAAKQDPVTGE